MSIYIYAYAYIPFSRYKPHYIPTGCCLKPVLNDIGPRGFERRLCAARVAYRAGDCDRQSDSS